MEIFETQAVLIGIVPPHTFSGSKVQEPVNDCCSPLGDGVFPQEIFIPFVVVKRNIPALLSPSFRCIRSTMVTSLATCRRSVIG